MSSKVVCRVCANVLPTEENLHKFGAVSAIYYRLTALQPPEATLPDETCRDCYDKLLLFDGFRTVCLDAYDQLISNAKENLHQILQLEKIKKEIESTATSDPKLNLPNPGSMVVVKVETYEDVTESDNDPDDDSVEAGDIAKKAELKPSEAEDYVAKDEDTKKVTPKSKKSKDEGIAKDGGTKKVVKKPMAKREKCEKIYCDLCEKFFYSEDRYEAHIRVHQGLKPAECEICNKEFAKFTYLKVHMDLVHAEVKKRVTCDVEGCGLSFATLHGMTSHKALKHLGKQLPKRRHVCEYCGKVFLNASLLKSHRDKHEGVKRHTCTVCGRSHDSRHKLKLHMMRHEGIKQFQCTICGLKTITISQLKVHMNRHTKEKQYPCQLCDAVFNSSGNKSRHVQLVHLGVRKFKCTYCDMAFGKAETLKNHTMIHTGEKPHGCGICGKRFIQLVAMQTHMKTHNK